MAIIDRILRAFNLPEFTQSDLTRAFEAGWNDANDDPPTGDLKSFGYQRQTAGGLRDFTKMSHDQIIEIVWTLYQSNPIAKRYLQIKRDYIIGRGVAPISDDDNLQEIFDDFFDHNLLHSRLPQMTLQQFLWGEQCYPAFVRKSDGRVTLGYIDPGEILTVVTHPQNAMEAWAVVCKQKVGDVSQKVYRIIKRENKQYLTAAQITPESWERELWERYGLTAYTGDCFYFAINNVSNQPRGFSDLLQVADWLDSHDETLFSLADREAFAGYFSWDVEIEDATEDQIRARAKAVRCNPPKKGSANLHNSKEKWTFVYPDLKQPGSIASAEAIETHALGGLGLPRHFYAHGDGTNRATAMAQGDPTFRTMQGDQDTIKEFILTMLYFVRDQARQAGYWKGKPEATVDLQMPEMTTRDLSRVTSTLSQLITSLTAAVNDLRLITKETAAKALAKVLAEIDIEYDPIEELKAAQQAAQDQPQPEPDAQAKATAQKAQEWLLERM